jgi:hypothetical protein
MNTLFIKPEDLNFVLENPGARERTLAAIEAFNKADEDLQKICDELGIEKPEMVL